MLVRRYDRVIADNIALGHGGCHSRVEIIPRNTSRGSEKVAVSAMARVFSAEDFVQYADVQSGVVNDMADGPCRSSFVDLVHPLQSLSSLDDVHGLSGDYVAEALALPVYDARREYVASNTVPFGFFDDGAARGNGLDDVRYVLA